jgi:hypothetical protein
MAVPVGRFLEDRIVYIINGSEFHSYSAILIAKLLHDPCVSWARSGRVLPRSKSQA